MEVHQYSVTEQWKVFFAWQLFKITDIILNCLSPVLKRNISFKEGIVTYVSFRPIIFLG